MELRNIDNSYQKGFDDGFKKAMEEINKRSVNSIGFRRLVVHQKKNGNYRGLGIFNVSNL